MSKVLIIGAGGVGQVVAHKVSQRPDVFSSAVLASRTLSRCETIQQQIKKRRNYPLEIAQVDADKPQNVAELIKAHKPKLVVNVALPYQDLSIMDACLEMGVDYLDTANYEPPDEAKFEYKWQWAYQERFKARGLMALLGSGFDPGVTNVYCAHAMKHRFDEIHTVDIMDCNGGDNGLPFATNFNPEINIREVTAKGRYWENGEWKETEPLSVHKTWDFAEVGPREMYLMYHEELESLAKNLKGLKRIRFWMTFGERYLNHLRVLEGIGMTSIKPIKYQGMDIVPLQFLKAVLPDPAKLGARTKGKTNIGCLIEGIKDGKPLKTYVYNVCDHEVCFEETDAQAVSYTTGVPAMIGAMMMVTGKWKQPGVWNMEQLDPDPFMEALNTHGLPWVEQIWHE
jgi:saccharopine dehydrogenase (NAD+, L-lysine-forming)